MSSALAIAAVTATLQRLLRSNITRDFPDLPDEVRPTRDIDFTSLPLDKARDPNNANNQINLFLYNTAPNAAYRNMDTPQQVRPGEVALPPLALKLYYLVTAYGEDNNEALAHLLLGQAMSLLHDHSILGREEIRQALEASGLHEQFERVRITMHAMSLDEMAKLWASFQTQFRISVAYEVSVILIDSRHRRPAALPVLKRGEGDAGPSTTAVPPPSIREVRPPRPQPSGRLGDDLTVYGEGLAQGGLVVRFRNQHLPAPIDLPLRPGEFPDPPTVHLPSPADDPGAMARWAPGFYTVALLVTQPGADAWPTSEVPFTLAPAITVTPADAPAGDVNLTVRCTPQLRPQQRVLLLFGERQVSPQPFGTPADPADPTELSFVVPAAAAGSYVIRLRVDGVDSLPFVWQGTPPALEFDPQQKVTIT